MSSSLLIILLVVVWLFVLAPMLIRSRNPIRRTGEALAETRTLYSGGSGRLVPRRARATVADPARVESDDSLFGLPSGDGATDAELLEVETWEHTLEQTLRHEAAGRRGAAVRKVMAERDREDRVATEPGADVPSQEVTTEIPAVVVVDEQDAAAAVGTVSERTASAVAVEVGPVEELDAEGPVVVDGELVEHPEGRRQDAEVEHAEDATGIDEEAVLLHRGRRRHPEPEVELTDADLDFAERRRGRGAYDPMADREAAERRAHARQRTALLLVGLATVAVVAALFTVPAVWWFAGGTVLLLASYLTYLRRQVRLEDSLRRRRVERMRRARLGVESREDDELSVVPPRLRRPGAVVLEVDDEDPAFDPLDHYDDELDTDPAHDDRPYHREPLRRAVG